MTKLSKEMENWRQAELRHAAVFGNAVLRTKGYQSIKLAELQKIYMDNRSGKMSIDDRVRMRLLHSGNRHLEKQLYPNRWVRYGRRMLRFTARVLLKSVTRIKNRIPAGKLIPRERGLPEKSENLKVEKEQSKTIVANIARLPKKVNKPLEGSALKEGRGI